MGKKLHINQLDLILQRNIGSGNISLYNKHHHAFQQYNITLDVYQLCFTKAGSCELEIIKDKE